MARKSNLARSHQPDLKLSLHNDHVALGLSAPFVQPVNTKEWLIAILIFRRNF